MTLRIILIVLHDETGQMYKVTNSEFRILICNNRKELVVDDIWTSQQNYNSYSRTMLNQYKQNHMVEQCIKKAD